MYTQKRKVEQAYCDLIQILTSKVKSMIHYIMPLMAGQSDHFLSKINTLTMKVNKQMTKGPTHRQGYKEICCKLNNDDPYQEIIKQTYKTIHKVIQTKLPKDIIQTLCINSRTSSKISVKGGTGTELSPQISNKSTTRNSSIS